MNRTEAEEYAKNMTYRDVEFHRGDIVVVTVKHPDGSETVTKGDIGIITEKEITGLEIDYTVHTWSSNYLYGGDQIRLATQEEKDAKLIDLMMK
jgi:hypothetical protein